jgi:LysM repeat protein
MVARNHWRYLAPVALIAVILATIIVVRGAVGSSQTTTTSSSAAQLPVTRHGATQKKFYVIRAGDSLSTISVKTGVPVATLESLNSSVNPNALQTGQRLRLRP